MADTGQILSDSVKPYNNKWTWWRRACTSAWMFCKIKKFSKAINVIFQVLCDGDRSRWANSFSLSCGIPHPVQQKGVWQKTCWSNWPGCFRVNVRAGCNSLSREVGEILNMGTVENHFFRIFVFLVVLPVVVLHKLSTAGKRYKYP
jgi:hypothetical protein